MVIPNRKRIETEENGTAFGEALQRQGLRVLARMIARQYLNTVQPHKEGQTDRSEESSKTSHLHRKDRNG